MYYILYKKIFRFTIRLQIIIQAKYFSMLNANIWLVWLGYLCVVQIFLYKKVVWNDLYKKIVV